MYARPNIVISKCIEHGNCRYDGSMISCSFARDMMPYVNFLPLCPEIAIGLPSPRESLRLVLTDGKPRFRSYKLGTDRTDEVLSYAARIAGEISVFEPDGFILKSRSPSCGVKDVKVYKDIGKASPLPMKERGIFGGAMMDSFPGIMFEDEGRLLNFSIREHFYTFIFTLADYREKVSNGTMKDLIKFQSRNKYLFMAFSQSGLKKLGKIVANHEKLPFSTVSSQYLSLLMEVLTVKPPKSRYINVMLHIFGYFKNQLMPEEKSHFLDILEQYRDSRIPQSAVMAVLGSWGIRFKNEYLKDQTIFSPFPSELAFVTDSGKGL